MSKPKVFITRRIPQVVIDRVAEHCEVDLFDSDDVIPRDELLSRVAGVDGVISLLTEKVDGEFLDAAGPQLKIVANFAVGYDNIDVAACTERGIPASNTPDVLTDTTADIAWALMMATARRVAEGDRFLRAQTPWIWGPLMMLGMDIHGKTLGIAGFGRIGQAVAHRAKGFGMNVIYWSRSRAPHEVEDELNATAVEFHDLLEQSDFISINCALTPETRHLFGAEQFKAMKETAILVNTARGPVVDEGALAAALKAGDIWGAGIDVFEKEPEIHPDLLACDNAVIIPHLGSATVETRIAMGMKAADNLLAVLSGQTPPTLINPQVWNA